MDSIKIVLDKDLTLELESDLYFESLGDICVVRVAQTSEDYFSFGEALLRKYYTIFDYDNNQIGFIPQRPVDKPISLETTLIIVFAVLLVFAVISACFIKSCRAQDKPGQQRKGSKRSKSKLSVRSKGGSLRDTPTFQHKQLDSLDMSQQPLTLSQ